MLRDTVSKMDLWVFGGIALICSTPRLSPEVVHMCQSRVTACSDMILRIHTYPRH